MNQGRQVTSLFSYLFFSLRCCFKSIFCVAFQFKSCVRVSFEHRKRYCCMQNLQELRSDNADNILFNLSRNIVALQVETLFCAYYHVRDQLFWQQNTVLRQHVSQSSLKFYFLQQILVVLLVLPLKLQRVSQQICD